VYALLVVRMKIPERKAWLDSFVDSHVAAVLNTAVFEWDSELY
jgi:hypothetical protein